MSNSSDYHDENESKLDIDDDDDHDDDEVVEGEGEEKEEDKADDDVRFVLDQVAELDSYSVSSLKQQSADRHVALLWHIIPIPWLSGFGLTP